MPRLRRPRHPVALLRQTAAGLLLLAALVLALRPDPHPPAAAPEPATVPVVTAARDLPAGTVLADDDLTVRPVPVDMVPTGVSADPVDLLGRVLAGLLRAGEAVTDVRLVGPGLWSQVPPGQVATPVRLADLAVSGLLRAGDRVDVLATAADGGTTEVVAAAALVLTVPTGAEQDPGLLVLAVPPETATRLAGAAATATLTVTVGAA